MSYLLMISELIEMIGRIGGVELAPMSTSKDMGVALKYAQTNCISSIIFEYEVL